MSEARTVETERLLLRPFRYDDAEALHAMHRDEVVMQYSGGLERFTNISQTLDYMAMALGHWQLFGFGKWAVEHRQSGILVGRVGLNPSASVSEPELGWLLGRDHWHKGFATEAATAALRFGFDVLGGHRIVSLIEAANHASIAVARRLGENPDGEITHYGVVAQVYAIESRVFESSSASDIPADDLVG